MGTEFRNWRERLAAADGSKPERVRYSRKSTESEDRQVASHDQQSEAADKEWGSIAPEWWWRDNCSGTSFDRPAFQDLLDFCQENPRAKASPGRVEIYDPSRFGRTLDEDGKPDIMTFQSVFSQFERYGWKIHFVTLKRTGDQLVDIILIALYAYAAALFSATLSRNVRRGRRDHARQGWWLGGAAPWGTFRKDTRTGNILQDGELSTPGGGGTILVPNAPVLTLWARMARLSLGGASLDAVGVAMYKEGVRGPRGGKLGHRSVRNFLTNPALVGEVEYIEEDEHGHPKRRRRKAAWQPMVDVDLFKQVSKHLGGHSVKQEGRKRRRRELFPLKPVCAHCGVEYNGGRLSAAQGAARSYVHAKPKPRMDESGHARFVEAGCKVWYMDAEEVETKIKDLIVAQRSSVEFEELVRELILERDSFRQSAEEAVAQAKHEVAQRERAYRRLAKMAHKVAAATAADENVDDQGKEAAKDDDPLVAELTAAKQALEYARSAVADAERFAESRESAWERLSGIIHETRNLAAAWARVGPEERKILLDYWVMDVLVVVEPIPDMRRANRKTALVTLRTAPNAPMYFELGGDQLPSRAMAQRTSSRTAASDSTEARARSGSSASRAPKRPSAHAAWARTSGSGSESTPASAGTSSSDPTLPRTTAALRRSPRSLARFMGEPQNASANSSCDIASSSSASSRAPLPASTARGANGESSDSSRENLRVYGHTSWEICRQTRFETPLGTGGRTLRGVVTAPAASRISNRAATFRPVRRLRVSSPLAVLLLLLVALASPGAALAHGLAHHHLFHEHSGDHDAPGPEHEHAAVSVPDHGHEHQHPSVDQATSARTDAPLAIAAAAPELPVVLRMARGVAAPTPRALLRGDPHSGPPPNPRAPPPADLPAGRASDRAPAPHRCRR